ncbi:MAG TPA: hypothetical protein VK968_17235, partial [Roseimicrobium sp.]|nr:hypothetical protein [Roseimicrobium sp.]
MKLGQSRLEALELARGKRLSAGALERVARATDVESAAWAFSQWDLRSRAKTKFAKADEMLFVREALEQASHEAVAAYHASRFPYGALVTDMTTGIGADLIALAGRGPVVGFELDPERAAYARWNLAVYGLDGSVVVGDSVVSMPPVDYAFVDPARRVEGRRTLRLESFSPNVAHLRERLSTMKLGVIKLTPMLSDADLLSIGVGVEFVSFSRECREALVFLGSEAKPGVSAVHLESGQRVLRCPPGETAVEPGEFFFEADPAAIRAN